MARLAVGGILLGALVGLSGCIGEGTLVIPHCRAPAATGDTLPDALQAPEALRGDLAGPA